MRIFFQFSGMSYLSHCLPFLGIYLGMPFSRIFSSLEGKKDEPTKKHFKSRSFKAATIQYNRLSGKPSKRSFSFCCILCCCSFSFNFLLKRNVKVETKTSSHWFWIAQKSSFKNVLFQTKKKLPQT